MTLNELIQYAKRRLVIDPLLRLKTDIELDIAAAIPTAIHEMSIKVMRDAHLRPLLQQSYSVALDGSGIGNLLTATGSLTTNAGEILQEGVPMGLVRDAENNDLVWIPNLADFYRPAPTVFGYYTLVAQRIYTRAISAQVNSIADIVSAPTPLTVIASFAPAEVADVPEEIEDDLVGHVVEVVLRKIGAPADA